MALAVFLIFFAILGVLVWCNVRSGLLPDQCTWGGVLCGLVVSAFYPELHGNSGGVDAALSSLGGAFTGYLAGWLVCEGGKFCFGTRRITSAEGMRFELVVLEGKTQFVLDEVDYDFEEMFSRVADRLTLKVTTIRLATSVPVESSEITEVGISHDSLSLNEQRLPLENVTYLSGLCSEVKVPREVMGFGIVKMMAFVGAFLGWQGVLIVFGFSFVLFFAAAFLLTHFLSLGKVAFAPFVLVAPIVYLWWR